MNPRNPKLHITVLGHSPRLVSASVTGGAAGDCRGGGAGVPLCISEVYAGRGVTHSGTDWPSSPQSAAIA